MKLRDYSEADTAALAALFTDAVHTLAANHYDATQREAWAPRPPAIDEWRKRFAPLRTLVAEQHGACLGFLSYADNGHIDLLYVAPAGARGGIATALLREATARLSAGGTVSELTTEASLVAAAFFLQHGFEIVEEQNVLRRGISFRRFAMRKQLA